MSQGEIDALEALASRYGEARTTHLWMLVRIDADERRALSARCLNRARPKDGLARDQRIGVRLSASLMDVAAERAGENLVGIATYMRALVHRAAQRQGIAAD